MQAPGDGVRTFLLWFNNSDHAWQHTALAAAVLAAKATLISCRATADVASEICSGMCPSVPADASSSGGRRYDAAIRYWRHIKHEADAQTRGILYWQLNDIWEGASWSGINRDGSWRLMHHAVARAYAPLLASAHLGKVPPGCDPPCTRCQQGECFLIPPSVSTGTHSALESWKVSAVTRSDCSCRTAFCGCGL